MTSELLPCPFCGGEAFCIVSVKITQPSRYLVRCVDYLVETPSCEDEGHIKLAWNTRIRARKEVIAAQEKLYRAQVTEHERTTERLREQERETHYLRGELVEHQRRYQSLLDWVSKTISELADKMRAP